MYFFNFASCEPLSDTAIHIYYMQLNYNMHLDDIFSFLECLRNTNQIKTHKFLSNTDLLCLSMIIFA